MSLTSLQSSKKSEEESKNPWVKLREKWFHVDGPLDQGRIAASNLPLPPKVYKRVRALKKILKETSTIEEQFYQELHLLEAKFHMLQSHCYRARSDIVREHSINTPIPDITGILARTEGGIQHFWLKALTNSDYLSEFIEDHDKPVLEFLQDIQVVYYDKGFGLDFIFAPNKFFTNSILSVEYITKYRQDRVCFGGPDIIGCRSSPIEWLPGKNVTQQQIKKRKKKKKEVVPVYQCSFFHLFDAPTAKKGQKVTDPEELIILESYAEVASFIKDRLVPRAVLYYVNDPSNEEFDLCYGNYV